MSNAGQALSAVAGAVIGFFVGGPQGAYYGFQIGYLAGTALFPTQLPHLQGPRIGDGQQTVSVVGQPIPWIFGTQTVGGNIIWASPIREVATTQDVGGKGGPEQSQTTYTYFRSFAILLCEGPIAGVRRVWANGKIVYDARSQLPDEDDDAFLARQAVNGAFLSKVTIYLGAEDQMPDPVIESFKGVGNVPAYRGYAYVVFDDVELKPEDGNRIPASWKFEVYEDGDSDSINLDQFSNEVLYPWLSSGAEIDPRDARNKHTYYARDVGGSGPLRDVLDDALADAKVRPGIDIGDPIPLLPEVLGWSTSSQFTYPLAPYRPVEPVFDDQVELFLWFNPYAPTPKVTAATGAEPICTFIEATGYSQFWWTGEEAGAIVGLGHGVWFLSQPQWYDAGPFGGCQAYRASDHAIATARVPSAPANPCASGVSVPGLPGFCISEGVLYEAGDWELDESTTYRVLQKYQALGTPAKVVKYPLNPARPLGHSQYDDQQFWESAYELAVARGDMASGLTYGVDYPVTQGYAYRKQQNVTTITVNPVSIASIVSRICDRVGLPSYDVSDLEDRYVIGYQVARPMAARAAIEPMRQVGFFDVVESVIQLKFPVRGKSHVATLTADDQGAYFVGGQRPSAITTQKKLELELPRQIRVHFQNPEADYDPGEELSPSRFDTGAETVLDVDLGVAITPTHAAQVAEVLFRDTWTSRWGHVTQVDQSQSSLEPADCILTEVDGRLERTRIASITDQLPNLRTFELLRDDDGAYESTAVGTSSNRPTSQLPFVGPVDLSLLDIPPLSVEHTNAGIYFAARPLLTGIAFRGAVLHRSRDGSSYTVVSSVTSSAESGTVITPLPDGPHTVFDEGNSLTVELVSGDLESRSEDDVLGGANAAAVGVHGRWEIIQFKNATRLAGDVWQLSGFLRGRRGTEHFIGTGKAGDRFVMLSTGGVGLASLDILDIDETRFYVGAPIGTPFAINNPQSLVSRGEILRPFSPVHIQGTRNDDGDLTITWVRRDRLASPDGLTVPMSEEVEDYEIDIIDSNGDVRRTISVSTQQAIYTAEQQIDDFGVEQESVSVRIYQISVDVRRGAAGVATL